jgi:thiol-disulfide isomerase/thioredoxin
MTHVRKRLAVLGCTVALMLSTRSFAQHPASPKENLQVPPHGPSLKGKRARNFVLYDLSGKPVSLKDYAGKPVVVNFWATWCPPCLLEMPWFEQLANRYSGTGLTVLGLSTDIEGQTASPSQVVATVKRLRVTYPILLYDGSLKATYGPVYLLPETFYINRKGMIVEDVWGDTDKETIERNIGEIVR